MTLVTTTRQKKKKGAERKCLKKHTNAKFAIIFVLIGEFGNPKPIILWIFRFSRCNISLQFSFYCVEELSYIAMCTVYKIESHMHQRERDIRTILKAMFLRSLKIAPFSSLLRCSREKPAIFELRKKRYSFESCSNIPFPLVIPHEF